MALDQHTDGGTLPPADRDIDGGAPRMLDASAVSSDGDAAFHSDSQAATTAGDPDQPWQLDCAHLPSDGVCQGGPHEVVLATTDMGDILMFAPEDGHYIGPLKGPSQNPTDADDGYQLATQGPDQCIWTVSADGNDDTYRAVERWNTDGTFRDDIIPRGKYDRGGADRLEGARTFAFGPDFVLVGSGNGTLNTPQVSRYQLNGTFERELFAAHVESLLVLNDGSLLSGGEIVQRWSQLDGMATNVFTQRTSQVVYAGNGVIYASDLDDATIWKVRLDNGNASALDAVPSAAENVGGIAVLDDGKLLYSDDDLTGVSSVYVFDPSQPMAPRGQPVFATVGQNRGSLPVVTHFGRACLPEAIVARKPVVAAEVTMDHCDDVPAGAALLSEDFENGDFSGIGTNHSYRGWADTGLATKPSEISTDEHVSGTRALKVYPGPDSNTLEGIAHTFASIKPSYIGYYQKIETGTDTYAEVALGGDGTLEEIWVNGAGVGDSRSRYQTHVDDGSWVRVQLRNIDWDKMTFDLYVNCKRAGVGIWLEPDVGTALEKLQLIAVPQDPTDPQPAYYDDIVIK